MIDPPERSPERDAAVEALLAVRPFPGWTIAALQSAAGPDADLLFPGGSADLIEAYADLGDRRMIETPPTEARLHERVRALIATRLEQQSSHKEAVRRALGRLSVPGQARRAAAVHMRTMDAIWYAAGDRSADFSWYTKRAVLTGVYVSTLLYWLRDRSHDLDETLAFLDRRLANVARLGRPRGRAAPSSPAIEGPGGHAGKPVT